MGNEAESGSAEAPEGGRHPSRGGSEPTPLQGRAKFLENWSWASVTQINAGLCERGRAQRGANQESYASVAQEWEERRVTELTLLDTFQFLRSCHRRAPFLFYNGNTFAEIGRALATVLFRDLPFPRRKEATSLVAHYITGVLEQELMVSALDSLAESADFQKGDRVKTLKGSTRGVVVEIRADGKVSWRADGSKSELLSLPEGLLHDTSNSEGTE